MKTISLKLVSKMKLNIINILLNTMERWTKSI